MDERREGGLVPLLVIQSGESEILILLLAGAAGGLGLLVLRLGLGWVPLLLVEIPFLAAMALMGVKVGGYRLLDLLVLLLYALRAIRGGETPWEGRITPEGGSIKFF